MWTHPPVKNNEVTRGATRRSQKKQYPVFRARMPPSKKENTPRGEHRQEPTQPRLRIPRRRHVGHTNGAGDGLILRLIGTQP